MRIMMFKLIPRTNDLYEMSIDGVIRRKDGLECTLTSLNDKPAITLTIYGKEKTCSIEWLRLMTHFEIDLKYTDFFNVYFTDTHKWHKGNTVSKTMLFYGQRPEYKPGFRIIPEFTRYAVSKEGAVIDTYLHTEIERTNPINGYSTVYIYNPDRNEIRSTLIHRLVALAWVKNPDHMKYYLVNHKDGNKHNPYYANLEWTNHKGNAEHAYENGLRSQNTECKVRNIETNKIKEFKSVRDACFYMGVRPKCYFLFVKDNSNRPINNKYEIRLLEDNTPWNLNLFATSNDRVRTKITIVDEKNDEIIVYGIKELNILFGIDPSIRTFDKANKHAEANGLTLKFETVGVKRKIQGPIQVYNIVTNEIMDFSSLLEASKILGMITNTIKQTIKRGETSITNGYAFRYKTDKKWNTNFVNAINKPKCILAIDKNGKEYECNSLRIAERLTKINRKAINRALLNLPIESDWHFRYK